MIPVVYSSFTNFYNPKTKLFTSGNKESLGDRVAVVLCGDLAHRGVGGSRAGVNRRNPAGRCLEAVQSTWHQSLGWVNSGRAVIKYTEGCFH